MKPHDKAPVTLLEVMGTNIVSDDEESQGSTQPDEQDCNTGWSVEKKTPNSIYTATALPLDPAHEKAACHRPNVPISLPPTRRYRNEVRDQDMEKDVNP